MSSAAVVIGALRVNIYQSNSVDDKLVMFFLLFLENRIRHFMQIVSIADNLHGMPNPVFWEK